MRDPKDRKTILLKTNEYDDVWTSFQIEKGVEILEKNHVMDIRIAQSAKEAEELWKIRKSIGSLAAQIRTHNISEDVVVPISKIREFNRGAWNRYGESSFFHLDHDPIEKELLMRIKDLFDPHHILNPRKMAFNFQ